MRGKVQYFHTRKGYGFLKGSNGQRYFFHYSNIQMEGLKILNIGDVVSFKEGKSSKGKYPHAVGIKPILTLRMVLNELAKDELQLMRIGKGKGSGWYIIDQNHRQVVNQTMNLQELAEYTGLKARKVS